MLVMALMALLVVSKCGHCPFLPGRSAHCAQLSVMLLEPLVYCIVLLHSGFFELILASFDQKQWHVQ
jgi:hypothetical protein